MNRDSDSRALHPSAVCLVTGATSGIGFEVARGLARRGAEVIGVGRDPGRCTAAAGRIRCEYPEAQLHYEVADLSKQSEVHELCARLGTLRQPIDVVLNNAATFTTVRKITGDGIEQQFAVNYLAGFLLVGLLLPLFAGDARVINVTSGSHFSGRIHWNNLSLRPVYNGLAAYAQSKLANVVFSYELARRFGRATHITSHAVDPGLVDTKIGLKGTGPLVRAIWGLRSRSGVSAAEAAAPIAELALACHAPGPAERYWKGGALAASSARSYDPSSGTRLWEMSERMCGLSYPPARSASS